MASSSSELPLAIILHLLTIKLTSSNYLIWKNQIKPPLSYQRLLEHVDGTNPCPPATIQIDGKSAANPAHQSWIDADQRTLLIIQSSLSEEAMAETLNLSTSHAIWQALEQAYSHDSMERVQTLRDSLRQMQKGSSSVSEFGRKFKGVCDQLSAVGHPVEETDKAHWFLCGLGSGFETFSTSQRAVKPTPSFRNLLSYAESHEIFMASIHSNVATTPVAFTANTTAASRNPSNYNSRGRGGKTSRGGGGRGRGGRRPPHCQLCRTNGHYASSCPDLSSYGLVICKRRNS